MKRTLVALAVLALALGGIALAQEAEVLTYTPSATPHQALVTGLRVQFVGDGGCLCRAESRIPNDAEPCNGALCTGARARAVVCVADAIDGGALDR